MPDAHGGQTDRADLRDVEAFLFREARLLDERKYEQWLDLFTDTATYWIPMQRGQDNALDTASLVYDDRMALEMRVRQLGLPNRHAQVARSWTSHLIGNIDIDDAASTPDTTIVTSVAQSEAAKVGTW